MLLIRHRDGDSEGVEIRLTERAADALSPLTLYANTKLSTTFPLADASVLVEAYQAPCGGLVIATFRFASPFRAQRFIAPSWCGIEVTDDPAYADTAIAIRISAGGDARE